MSATRAAAVRLPILLIEDEPTVRAFVRAALERHGYAVTQAANGVGGLRLLQSSSFSGVISDIRMPGEVDGADLHQWIQKNRPELRERMILISGDTANSQTLSLLTRSSTPSMEKPFRVSQLISLVEQTFGEP
jgi:DNA-binding NtrC family response regulator